MRQPITLQVHRLLAASAPEPLTCAAVAQRLGLALHSVEVAVCVSVRAECVRPVRRLDGGRGYAYTVAHVAPWFSRGVSHAD